MTSKVFLCQFNSFKDYFTDLLLYEEPRCRKGLESAIAQGWSTTGAPRRAQRGPTSLFWSVGLVAKLCLTLATPWTVACQAPLSMGIL